MKFLPASLDVGKEDVQSHVRGHSEENFGSKVRQLVGMHAVPLCDATSALALELLGPESPIVLSPCGPWYRGDCLLLFPFAAGPGSTRHSGTWVLGSSNVG